MPGLAKRQQREPCDVGRAILDVEAPAPEEMADRVDRPRDVVHEEDPYEPAPNVAAQRPTQGEAVQDETGHGGNQERDQHEQRKAPSDSPHARIVIELAGIAVPVRLTLGLEQPTGMCMPQTA